MPKKKSKEPEEEFDIKEFDKLDKLFDKDALSEEDKADQEEDEEQEEGRINLNSLREMEFSQFMGFSEPLMDTAPVLERIAGSQPRPIFVGGIPQTPVGISEEEKTDEFKYVPRGTGNDEPKYIASDSRISAEPTPIDLMKVGRKQTGMIPQVDQETFFMRSESRSQIESPTFERAGRVERIDIEKAGRRDIFEKEDVKYKPKLP